MEVLNTKETAKAIMNLITNSRVRCYLISPYFDFKGKYKKAILENKNCEFVIVYGKNELNYEAEDFIYDTQNINLLYCENLHAKIYLNEKECIISSMNLYKYSENNNIEISIKFNSIEKTTEGVLKIIEEIIKNSELEKSTKKKLKQIGYCIRTGVEIPLNVEKPFSYNAFKEWDKYKNKSYPENFCHLTGVKSNGKTSFENPILKKY